jgi:hypothetical protein
MTTYDISSLLRIELYSTELSLGTLAKTQHKFNDEFIWGLQLMAHQ